MMTSSIFIFAIIFLSYCSLVVAGSSSKFPRFVIQGKLTCRGVPIRANIVMVNYEWPVSHLLNERETGKDGKFRLLGDPEGDCLNVQLTVEHDCHAMFFDRQNTKKLDAHSIFHIRIEDLIKNNWMLDMDIELAEDTPKVSTGMTFWKAAMYFRRMVTDSYTRIKNLPIWKKT